MDTSAANICARTLEDKCDGVSLDFEVGDTRHNASFRGLYAGYVARVSAAATARNLTVGVVPTAHMSLPSNTGVDAAAIAAGASGDVVLMTYDYHWGHSDPVAGPNTPLTGNNGSSINTTLSFALAHAMPAASHSLGIAWYGREYPTVGPYYQAATNAVSMPGQTAHAYSLPMMWERANARPGRDVGRVDADAVVPVPRRRLVGRVRRQPAQPQAQVRAREGAGAQGHFDLDA